MTPLGTAILGDLAHVTACRSTPDGSLLPVPLPQRLVRRINHEAVAGHRGHGCAHRVGMRATTANGDSFVFFPAGRCSWTLPVLPGTLDPYPSWRPSISLARALNRLDLTRR
jgi:hypothetical protein